MKVYTDMFPQTPVIARLSPARLSSTLEADAPDRTGSFWLHHSERFFLQPEVSASSPLSVVKKPLIYAVDDLPGLTDLYGIVLKEAGYHVRTFNDRIRALVTLESDRDKPDLLIMDYLGHSLSAEQFIQYSRRIHPAMQIMVASSINPITCQYSPTKPDHFIQKPFTLEEFRREVEAALAFP